MSSLVVISKLSIFFMVLPVFNERYKDPRSGFSCRGNKKSFINPRFSS